ncbi:hypothetical protein CK203_013586 [Vitis vinifera]|uniref:Uncharacterized protein n=1 Tax=Vitis vinifera TaxID=29760 RepID=A0A438J8Y9_VITVI|nr:hypothetical protein CK203_013586 [Vitis vinifera]
MAAIKACQEQMLASQSQQAAILRLLQVHFDLPQAVEPSISTPPEPHSQPTESHPPEPETPADPPTEEQILLPSTTTPLIRHYIYFLFIKEVPLPPFYYSHSNHIEDNAQFGWGPGALSLNWLGVTDLNARYKE